MKRKNSLVSCCLISIVLMLILLPSAAFAADGSGQELVSISGEAVGAETPWSYSFTIETTGTLNVLIGECDPGWEYKIIHPDGSESLYYTASAWSVGPDADHELTEVGTYTIRLYAYDAVAFSNVDGTVSCVLTFFSGDVSQEQVQQEYMISDTALVEGINTLTMEEGALNTLFVFEPEQTGIYSFTAPEGVLIGNWNMPSFPTDRDGDDKSNRMEWTCSGVGQNVLIGVYGSEAVTLEVLRVGDAKVEEVVDYVPYVNTHTPNVSNRPTLDDGQALVGIDITVPQTVVLGIDGFYHLGSGDGPIVYVDLINEVADLYLCYYGGTTANTLRGISYGPDGSLMAAYDFLSGMKAYADAMDDEGMYPLTEDLCLFLKTYGSVQGWYDPSFSTFSAIQAEHDASSAWLVCCYYIPDEQVQTPTLTLRYPSLSFESEILYNVYYLASELEHVVEMGLVTFDTEVVDGSVVDAADVIPGYNTDGSLWLVQSNGISAKNLGDTVYFRVYAKLSNGSYVYSVMKSYSAVSYAKTILGRASSSENMKALVVAMLNYGAEAQKFFGHDVDALMNAGLTAEQQALVGVYDETMVDPVVALDSEKVVNFVYDGSSFARRAPTVSFDGAFSINYYFTSSMTPDDGMTLYYWDLDTYDTVDALSVDNASGSMEMLATDIENQFWGEVPDIAAKLLDQTVFVAAVYEHGGVTYSTGILNYSIGRYCEGIAAKDTSDQQAFAQATAVYGYRAKKYFTEL